MASRSTSPESYILIEDEGERFYYPCAPGVDDLSCQTEYRRNPEKRVRALPPGTILRPCHSNFRLNRSFCVDGSGTGTLRYYAAGDPIGIDLAATTIVPGTTATPTTVAVTVGPAWLSARYTYLPGSKQIQIEAASNDPKLQMKINRFDGQPLTLGNASNPSLKSGQFYPAGYQSDQGLYTQEWTFGKAQGDDSSGVPIVALVFTWINSNNEVFAFEMTPAANSRYQLFTAGSVTTKGGSTTLNPSLPSSDPEFDYIPIAESGRSNLKPELHTDNLFIRFNLKEGLGGNTNPDGSPRNNNGLGGGIEWIASKSKPQRNLIKVGRVYRDGATKDGVSFYFNTGQGLQECLYQLPQPWRITAPAYNGQTKNLYGDLGYNPLETGDDYGNNSKLLTYGTKVYPGNNLPVIYKEVTPLIFGNVSGNLSDGTGDINGIYNIPSQANFKSWFIAQGRTIKAFYESTFFRTDAFKVSAIQQEAPCVYLNGQLNTIVWYDGNDPYSGGATRQVALPNTPDGAASNFAMQPGGHFVTEPWIMAVDNNGEGFGLFMYDNHRSQIGKIGSGTGPDDGGDGGTTYINFGPMMILDANIKWRHKCVFFVGNVQQMREYVYSQTRPSKTPEFRFNQAGRQGWYFNENAHDDGYMTARSTWKVYFDKARAEVKSPAGAWKTSDFTGGKLYMRAKYTGNRTNLYSLFRRNGQKEGTPQGDLENFRYPNGNFAREEQMVDFAVTPGQWQVMTIDYSSKGGNFTGVINEIWIGLKYNAGDATPGESLEIEWISANPNGPAQ